MSFKVSVQLSLLMFFQFFIWGAWFVTMGTFLSQEFNSSGSELSLAYETQSIGAIIAPFIIGLIADKYFAAQKVLGTIHLFGALLLYNAGISENFSFFYPYILIYMLLYMPTLALANSVACTSLACSTVNPGLCDFLFVITNARPSNISIAGLRNSGLPI